MILRDMFISDASSEAMINNARDGIFMSMRVALLAGLHLFIDIKALLAPFYVKIIRMYLIIKYISAQPYLPTPSAD